MDWLLCKTVNKLKVASRLFLVCCWKSWRRLREYWNRCPCPSERERESESKSMMEKCRVFLFCKSSVMRFWRSSLCVSNALRSSGQSRVNQFAFYVYPYSTVLIKGHDGHYLMLPSLGLLRPDTEWFITCPAWFLTQGNVKVTSGPFCRANSEYDPLILFNLIFAVFVSQFKKQNYEARF